MKAFNWQFAKCHKSIFQFTSGIYDVNLNISASNKSETGNYHNSAIAWLQHNRTTTTTYYCLPSDTTKYQT